MRLLLEYGADTEATDMSGARPLHNACLGSSPDPDVVLLLIQHGADVNVRDKSNQTPLHYACSYRNPAIIGLLLENGADVNASVTGTRRRSIWF